MPEPARTRPMRAGPAAASLILALSTAPVGLSAAAGCDWREPPRTYPAGVQWTCTAADWPDGDTLDAKCAGRAGMVAVRVRRVDTDERGHDRWRRAREELRRWTAGHAFTVVPHHDSHRRVVADVLTGGVNVGAAMDAAGWSKADCPKR